MNNIWHDMSPGRLHPDDFYAVVEISKGGKAKYELDKETGLLKLDRVLYTSTHYPANYGFIPRTYANDNDPLDVLILCSENIIPMSLVHCYPIGVIIMDDSGDADEKIIAIPFDDPTYNSYKNITELPKHIFDEMEHFFAVYKQLEARKTTEISDVLDNTAAREIIRSSLKRYVQKFCCSDPDSEWADIHIAKSNHALIEQNNAEDERA